MKISRDALKLCLIVALMLSATVAFVAYRRANAPQSEDWLRKVNGALDETFRTNGMVEDGKHGWRAPRDGETNGRVSKQTNGVPSVKE